MRPLLIAFEGPDGAGKSENAESLRENLEDQNISTILTHWNSSRIIHPALKKMKRNRNLTNRTYSLMHCADFADRYDRDIIPALGSGKTVIADRWIYTAFARDVARGEPSAWVHNLYAFARQPDITFYLRVTIEEAYHRIHTGRQPKFYEAGMDLGLSDDIHQSFLLFQARVIAEYERMKSTYHFVEIDAMQPEEAVEAQVQQHVAKLLGGK